MAITITNAEIAVAIRAAANPDDIPTPIATTLAFLVPAGAAMILQHAPGAPDAVHNAALIRLAGWLYDADPTDSRISQALSVSGASPLLAQWRVHRAGAIGVATGTSPTPTPTPTPGGNVPSPPAQGTFVLGTKDGELVWVAFPLPA